MSFGCQFENFIFTFGDTSRRHVRDCDGVNLWCAEHPDSQSDYVKRKAKKLRQLAENQRTAVDGLIAYVSGRYGDALIKLARRSLETLKRRLSPTGPG